MTARRGTAGDRRPWAAAVSGAAALAFAVLVARLATGSTSGRSGWPDAVLLGSCLVGVLVAFALTAVNLAQPAGRDGRTAGAVDFLTLLAVAVPVGSTGLVLLGGLRSPRPTAAAVAAGVWVVVVLVAVASRRAARQSPAVRHPEEHQQRQE